MKDWNASWNQNRGIIDVYVIYVTPLQDTWCMMLLSEVKMAFEDVKRNQHVAGVSSRTRFCFKQSLRLSAEARGERLAC